MERPQERKRSEGQIWGGTVEVEVDREDAQELELVEWVDRSGAGGFGDAALWSWKRRPPPVNQTGAVYVRMGRITTRPRFESGASVVGHDANVCLLVEVEVEGGAEVAHRIWCINAVLAGA